MSLWDSTAGPHAPGDTLTCSSSIWTAPVKGLPMPTKAQAGMPDGHRSQAQPQLDMGNSTICQPPSPEGEAQRRQGWAAREHLIPDSAGS